MDDLGIWAHAGSIYLLVCSLSQMYVPSYDGLLLGLPKLGIWWLSHYLVHDGQLWSHSRLMFHGQGSIPTKFIQSHLFFMLFSAGAIFCFLVLHGVCDHFSKRTHYLKQVCFFGVNLPFKHARRGHDLFLLLSSRNYL